MGIPTRIDNPSPYRYNHINDRRVMTRRNFIF